MQCSVCNEVIPPYSRVCPVCCLAEHFSAEIKDLRSPLPLLDMLRSYLTELESLPELNIVDVIFRPNRFRDTIRELSASFEVVEQIIEGAYGRNRDVMQAVDTIYEMMMEKIDQRKQFFLRVRLSLLVLLVVVIAISLIFF